jgi:hypothetical protein
MKPPNLESFSERLPTLKSERNKRTTEIQRLKTECAEIRARLQSGTPNPGNEEEVRLRTLMGKEPIPLVRPDREQLNVLLVTIDKKNAEVGAFDAEILKENRVANNKLIESEMDGIKRRGNKAAKALADLCEADLEYELHLDSLEEVGATVGQYRIRLPGLGSPRDISSGYAYSLREFIDAGMISTSDLPKALR